MAFVLTDSVGRNSDSLQSDSRCLPISVFIGVDVACAKAKQLPICVVSVSDRLAPLKIPDELSRTIPRGCGNREALAPSPFRQAAQDVGAAFRNIAHEMDWRVERVAIDAPAAAPATVPRASDASVPCFQTPSASEWVAIRRKCADHVKRGGGVATLPHANKIWMLFGFELYAAIRERLETEVIETYPFAIVRVLLEKCKHKSTEQGYRDQLGEIARRTGWNAPNLEAELRKIVAGTRHDRLDAFMAAWVASLSSDRRRAFGDASRPDDAIWVPDSDRLGA